MTTCLSLHAVLSLFQAFARSRSAGGAGPTTVTWLGFWLDRDSVTAGIYVAFERQLLDNINALKVPAEAQDFLTVGMKTRLICCWLRMEILVPIR